jgi:hypothetical protein
VLIVWAVVARLEELSAIRAEADISQDVELQPIRPPATESDIYLGDFYNLYLDRSSVEDGDNGSEE